MSDAIQAGRGAAHAPQAAPAPERREPVRWVSDDNVALLVDLYELTMAQVYVERDMLEPAVFDLFTRTLPEGRNFLLATGLDDALHCLSRLRLNAAALESLEALGAFSQRFLDYLEGFSFTGSVRAMPEGTAHFGDEPIMSVRAPLPEAQLAETIIMNQVQFQTALASKGARVKLAAGENSVVDFGLRRMHGADAGLKSARAFAIAGVDGTSNVLAAGAFGVPARGTMAHAYVQAFEKEADSFDAFLERYGESSVLLIDTIDTIEGAKAAIDAMRRMGVRAGGVRLDSGDLASLAHRVRSMLDDAGFDDVRIFASGGLDEYKIDRLLRVENAPIDGFGVGTRMGVSRDAPALDMAYKLVHYAGEHRMKLSDEKDTLPGGKQVWRITGEDGRFARDVIALAEEPAPQGAEPMLVEVMRAGVRTDAGAEPLESARQRAREQLARLPERLRRLEPAAPAYSVETSERLARAADAQRKRLRSRRR